MDVPLGMSDREADTVYARRPWDQVPKYSYLGPFGSNEERLVQQALAVMDLPGEELQMTVRPPLPQINPFPPRYGYDRRALGVRDIIGMERMYPTSLTWVSGGVGAYTGTSRDTLGNGI
jgi:hypothetical protein